MVRDLDGERSKGAGCEAGVFVQGDGGDRERADGAGRRRKRDRGRDVEGAAVRDFRPRAGTGVVVVELGGVQGSVPESRL